VPILSEYITQRNKQELKNFIDRVAGTLGIILLIFTIMGVLGSEGLAMLFAPGFSDEPEKMALAAEMLTLTFPYLILISLTAFAFSILNAHNRFAIPAFTPIFLNLSLIACAIWLAPLMDKPIVALAWGVLIAGVIQLLFQFPFLMQLKLLPTPIFKPKDEGVRRIGKLMIPALFGVSVTQINLLLDTLIASFLVTGSISWLYYSDRLMEFPLGILGVALGTVILPGLSKQHTQNSTEAFSHTLNWALRVALFLGIPSAVGLAFLAAPMISTLFQSDVFTANDVLMAQQSLIAYSLGLFFFIMIKVLAPGFYAQQDTKTPVRIAIIAMIANMVFNLILVFPLQHAGLALATALSAALNAGLLFKALRQKQILILEAGWIRLIIITLIASSLMGGLLYWGVHDTQEWLIAETWDKIWRLLFWIFAGGSVYFIALFGLGVRLNDFKNHT